MLHLVEDIVLVDFNNNGKLALVVVFLVKELLLYRLGRTTEGHLMELCHVVAQTQLTFGILINKKIHQIHEQIRHLLIPV